MPPVVCVLWISGLSDAVILIEIFRYIVLGHETMINSGWCQNQDLPWGSGLGRDLRYSEMGKWFTLTSSGGSSF